MAFKFINHLMALALIGGLALAPKLYAASYTAQQLGTIGDFYNYPIAGGPNGYPNDINAKGQVIGNVNVFDTSVAALWQRGSTTAYSLSGGYWSWAAGMNAKGQIVGTSSYSIGWDDITYHATLWDLDSGTVTDLGTLGGQSSAQKINDSGQVIGSSTISYYPYIYHATLWQPGSTTAIDLGTLGGNSSDAFGINAVGEIVGEANTSSGTTHAALWQPGSTTAIDLGTMGGNYSHAHDIDTSGLIVGYATTSTNKVHAALWQPGTAAAVDLGTLGGLESWAYDVNASGEVVGESWTSDGYKHAAIWQAGTKTPVDLNVLVSLPDGYLTVARGINDRGQIIAQSSNGLPVLLTPIPLPSAFWLFGSALAGVIGFIRRQTER